MLDKQIQEEYKKKSKNVYWRTLREYLLMMWDGLAFFGFDDTKLDRLKGKEVEFKTKFKSYKWVIQNTLIVSFMLTILISQVSLLGTQKSQTI